MYMRANGATEVAIMCMLLYARSAHQPVWLVCLYISVSPCTLEFVECGPEAQPVVCLQEHKSFKSHTFVLSYFIE